MVYDALVVGRRSAVFLDFKSAFNVVGYAKLYAVLERRRCPPYILSLVACLMFKRVRSRVLVNGEVSR